MLEPLARSLELATAEEEELTSETVTSLECARASLAQGAGIPDDEFRRELGLKQ